MALYRADYIDTNGKVTGSVRGRDVNSLPASDALLTRHMQTIRPLASAAAQRAESDVLISRIIKGGQIKGALVAKWDGTFSRPSDTKAATDAGGEHKESGPCFCRECRLNRKVKRASR